MRARVALLPQQVPQSRIRPTECGEILDRPAAALETWLELRFRSASERRAGRRDEPVYLYAKIRFRFRPRLVVSV
jgi:hypothetical protein